MSTKKVLDLFYDKESDILYASSGSLTKNDLSEELGDDVVLWKDKTTNKVSGFTILNFSKRSKKAIIKLPFNVEMKEKILEST